MILCFCAVSVLVQCRFCDTEIALSKCLDDVDDKLALLLGNLEKLESDGCIIGNRCLDADVDVLFMVELYRRLDDLVYTLGYVGVYDAAEGELCRSGDVLGCALCLKGLGNLLGLLTLTANTLCLLGTLYLYSCALPGEAEPRSLPSGVPPRRPLPLHRGEPSL